MTHQEHIDPLTDEEKRLLQTPVRELKLGGLTYAALLALEKKNAIIRAENENLKAQEESNGEIA